MSQAPRDENYVPAALFEVDGSTGQVMPGKIDPLTGRILVDLPGGATGATGATGPTGPTGPTGATGPTGTADMAIGDPVLSGTSGSVLFVGPGPVLAQDNANLFWDDTNNRLGIGTTTPLTTLSLASGQISTPDGTISNPSYSFGTDLNTGMYLAAADTLGFSAGGIQRANLTGGAFSATVPLRGTGASATAPALAANADSNTGIFFPIADTLGFSTNGTERMRIDSSGNVGIKTTDVTYRTTNAGSPVNQVIAVGTTGGGFGRWGIDFNNGGTDVGYNYNVLNTSSNVVRVATIVSTPVRTAGSETGNLRFFTKPSGSAALERMTITDAGNIGIGTSSPSARLHTISTTEQVRTGYDTSNYFSTTVSSTGGVTFDAVGSGAGFTFSDPILGQVVRATGSGGIEVENSSGTDVAIFGAGASTGTSLLGTTNIGSASTDYFQMAGGTGTVTNSAVGGSTNIGFNYITKGTGRFQVNAVNVPTVSSTDTFTNKRVTARVTTITSSATPTINTDDCDAVTITALATAITSMTTNLSGTPTNFQKLIFRIKDNGTARAITWGSSFQAMGVALPTTTVISKVLTVGFIYDTVTSKWGCVASAQEA